MVVNLLVMKVRNPRGCLTVYREGMAWLSWTLTLFPTHKVQGK